MGRGGHVAASRSGSERGGRVAGLPAPRTAGAETSSRLCPARVCALLSDLLITRGCSWIAFDWSAEGERRKQNLQVESNLEFDLKSGVV